MSPSQSSYCVINFLPSLDYVPVVRQFVEDFYGRMLADPDATSRLAITTHELLENAAKHSREGDVTLYVNVLQEEGEDAIAIKVVNRADDRHRRIVNETVKEVGEQPDILAYYQQVMLESALRTESSGLGLARICAEAEMSLQCDIEGDEVSVVARGPVTLKVRQS